MLFVTFQIDLRWGVTEEVTKSNQTLVTCLEQVSQCHLFVGLLSERYGWVPRSYDVQNTKQLAWVHDYPTGRSVTELEMHCAALSRPSTAQHNAFFFIRDSSFVAEVPEAYRADFVDGKESSTKK